MTINSIYGKQRFDREANRDYTMPVGTYTAVSEQPLELMKIVYQFINHHQNHQVSRLQTLYDYYQANNAIKKQEDSNNPYHANNRVAAAFARYMTSIRVGYLIGNPIQLKLQDDTEVDDSQAQKFQNVLDTFITNTNADYVNQQLAKDLSITGRAYDLVYVKNGVTDLGLVRVDPEQAFVIYDDTVDHKPLVGVRYYQTGILDNQLVEHYEVYTDSQLFTFHSQGGLPQTNSPVANAVLDDTLPHFFDTVPLTEYRNNDERLGDWEPELDQLDALDKSVSMMADFQEDFNNANIVLTGKFSNMTEPKYLLDENGNKKIGQDGQPIIMEPAHPNVDPKNHMWYLEPFAASGGVGSTAKHIIQPDAKYLTKQYDAAGWSTYTNFLINEIHKYTNTPNVNDPNFASNASGVAMSYKLWGSDQERKLQETLFKRGLHDRLNACVNYWQTLNQISTDKWNKMIKANFMPNLPKNDDATAQLIQLLNGTGKFSDETIRDMAEPITGINADTEAERVKDDAQAAKEDDDNYAQGDGGLGNIFATGKPTPAPSMSNSEDTTKEG